jgi:FkbM family methyltransferase
MKKIERLRLYTISEMFQIVKLFFGHKLVNSIPNDLRKMHNLIGYLYNKGVKVKKNKDLIFFEYNINKIPFLIYLKKNSSDLDVFRQIIMNAEYNSVIDIINKYNIPCTTMVDAGANIGLTSIYFKSHFPELNIIALEPSNTTFNRLEKNINRHEGIKVLMKGIWGHSTYLSPDTSFRDGKDWAFRLVETFKKENGSIEVVSILDIIYKYKLEFIDFLKIDIEGGEVSVFSLESNFDWLKIVRLIAIEIHDEFNCRNNIENLLKKFGFELSYSGELTIGINRNLLN